MSFAAYASHYLNNASSSSASQPMFFSFTTDDGHITDDQLHDTDDPHITNEDSDDPYLRLDEDFSSPNSPLLANSARADSPPGWLAHQPSQLHSPSPASTASATSSDSSPVVQQKPHHVPPPPPRTLSLEASQVPMQARQMDTFSLPDPRHFPPHGKKHNDALWTALWLASVSACLVSCIVILVLTTPSSNSSNYRTLLHTIPLLTILTSLAAIASYTHVLLLRTFARPIFLATALFVPFALLISALCAFIGSFMWEADVEPTWGESIGLRIFSLVPLTLSIITARRLRTLPQSTALHLSRLAIATRILSLHPLLLALSPAILLATLLLSIPFVTLLFRLILIGWDGSASRVKTGFAIAATAGVWLWTWGVARGILQIASAGVVGAWYFGEDMGVQEDPEAGRQSSTSPPEITTERTFLDNLLDNPLLDTHTLNAAVDRATTTSLGTAVLAALILAGVRSAALSAHALRWLLTGGLLRLIPSTRFGVSLPSYAYAGYAYAGYGLPAYAIAARLAGIAVGWLELVAVRRLETWANGLSGDGFALIYTGMTGAPFWDAAERGRALAKSGGNTADPLSLLTSAPLTLSFPFALGTYLFVAHTLGAPDDAFMAAVLSGTVTALVGVFCVGVVRDAADTLYLCFCIDKAAGERRRQDVFAAFEIHEPSRSDRGRGVRLGSPVLVSPLSRLGRTNAPQPVASTSTTFPVDTKQALREYTPSPSNVAPAPPSVPSPIPEPEPEPEPEALIPDIQDEEDLDPFEQSYLEEEEHTGVMEPSLRLMDSAAASPTQSVQSSSTDGSQLYPGSGFF